MLRAIKMVHKDRWFLICLQECQGLLEISSKSKYKMFFKYICSGFDYNGGGENINQSLVLIGSICLESIIDSFDLIIFKTG